MSRSISELLQLASKKYKRRFTTLREFEIWYDGYTQRTEEISAAEGRWIMAQAHVSSDEAEMLGESDDPDIVSTQEQVKAKIIMTGQRYNTLWNPPKRSK